MKSLTKFLREVLRETGTWCHTSTIADYKTVCDRVDHEGLSFLTITLPDFGKAFERSLDQGKVDSSLFTGFRFKDGLPLFLGGFLCQVFNRGSGTLLDTPSIDAIRAIRQITLLFGKIGIECSEKRRLKALRQYVQCELDVQRFDNELKSEDFSEFKSVGRVLWSQLFSDLDLLAYNGELLPKHGPGSTADGLHGNAKYNQQEWTDRLEELFPSWEYLASSWSGYNSLAALKIHEPGQERPVKVITVPKTLKTPRIIAEEPTAMQYVQQGILEQWRKLVDRDDFLEQLVGIEFQEPNQLLAREGSVSGSLATLDLSEASDRVSNQHVMGLLENHPWLRMAVSSCRSTKADVSDLGVLIPLSKFASMGSALCFPFEAMVFATVVYMGIGRALNVPVTRKLTREFAGKVRVYGDDIIVPVNCVDSVISCLNLFGFKVNYSKSFWTGKFRESCGKEYYDGHDVSIVRVRSVFPTSRKQPVELVKTVALRNLLFEAGFSSTVNYLDTFIEKLIPFPVVERTSSALGRWSYESFRSERMHPDLQTPLVKAAYYRTVLPSSRLDGYGALMKFFLRRGDEPFEARHLLVAGRPVSGDIKTRWTRPY
jgi:hypothetical protein